MLKTHKISNTRHIISFYHTLLYHACTTLKSQKYKFAANQEENADKSLLVTYLLLQFMVLVKHALQKQTVLGKDISNALHARKLSILCEK